MHKSADVAATFMPSEKEKVDCRPIETKWFVGPGPQYRYCGPESQHPKYGSPILLGYQVCAIGLFVQDFGMDANLPIARFGHVSRKPSYVPIEIYEGDKSRYVAWLIEMLSWGGVSGSPVLVEFPAKRTHRKPTGEVLMVQQTRVAPLLGLVSGHFHKPEKAVTKGDVLGEIRTRMNTGIAIVTPACAILELLEYKNFSSIRESHIKIAEDSRHSCTETD